MKLSAAYFLLAHRIQEAATGMCHEDIRTRLRDALDEAFKGTGNWCYVVAVFGDDKSGDLVYSCNSDLKKAPYTMTANKTTIDTVAAVDVQPLTTYEPEAVEVGEAGRRNSGRDLKQLQAIHDASMNLGAACTKKESAPPANVSRETDLKLSESAFDVPFVLSEAKSDYEIKLIAPGKGSTAFYPAEVLKRDGPKVFTKETHVYVNHPTSAEESARPEGDVKNLAAVLTTDAVYYESHKNGPGLYARMKVFADHATMVEEKAAHVGMSIRAAGIAESGQLKDGVPVLKELVAAESVDIVTRAGAGGMILTESAVPTATPTKGADDMDAAELKKLNERLAASDAVNAKLLERAIKADAREAAVRILEGVTLPDVSKTRIIDSVLREALPKTEAGELDAVKFAELVNQEAKREGRYVAELTGAGDVTGLGTGEGLRAVETDPVKAREAATLVEANEKTEFERAVKVYESMGMGRAAAELAAKGRAA